MFASFCFVFIYLLSILSLTPFCCWCILFENRYIILILLQKFGRNFPIQFHIINCLELQMYEDSSVCFFLLFHLYGFERWPSIRMYVEMNMNGTLERMQNIKITFLHFMASSKSIQSKKWNIHTNNSAFCFVSKRENT